MELGHGIDIYLSELVLIGRSPKTVELQTCLLHTFAKTLGSRRSLSSVGRNDVMIYLASLAERRLAQSYIGTNGKTIRRFFGWATEQGEIKHNPLESVRIAMGPDKPVPPFTDDECRRLIDACNSPMKRAVLFLLLDTGMRASELTNLRLQDIDLVRSQLTIVGKGGKVRQLALNVAPRRMLRAYIAGKVQQDGNLWPGGWDRKNLGALVDSLARQARVPRCFPHRFRHNFAVRLRRQGVDAVTIQHLLGHSSLRMTIRYINWCEQEEAVKVHKAHPIAPAA